MDDGRAVECAPPAKLQADRTSLFSQLMAASAKTHSDSPSKAAVSPLRAQHNSTSHYPSSICVLVRCQTLE
eukprot:g28091.t1